MALGFVIAAMLATAPAQDADQILQALSNELMSPYCPGRTIASCPSDQARKLEDHILKEARAGKTREEIEADLVARFGDEIVGYAPPPGVLYAALILGLLALLLVARAGRNWARRRPAAVTPGDASRGEGAKARAPSAAERDKLEDALDEEDGF